MLFKSISLLAPFKLPAELGEVCILPMPPFCKEGVRLGEDRVVFPFGVKAVLVLVGGGGVVVVGIGVCEAERGV